MSEEGESLLLEPRGRSVLTHSLLVAVALGIGQLLAYAVSVIAARRLGPDQFGVFAALLGLLLIGSVLAMGIQAVAARRLVQLPVSERGRSARSMLRAALVGGLGVAVATIVIGPLLMWLLRLDSGWPLLLAAVSFVPLTWGGGLLGVAQGRESFPRLAAIYLAMGAGRGIGGIVGALFTGTVIGTMAGLAIGSTIGVLVGRVVVAPLLDRPRAPLSRWWPETAHATHALLALFLLTNVDVLLARALLTPAQAGEYGVGAVIAKVAFWLPQFVGVMAFPRFADSRRSRATVISLGAIAGMGLIVIAATLALPRLVVGIVGGSAYVGLVPYAWMFACIGAAFALAQALLLTRLAVDDRRAVIAVWSSAALLAVLAAWVLPRSVPGLASSALIAGSALVVVGLVVTVRELRTDQPPAGSPLGSDAGQGPGDHTAL